MFEDKNDPMLLEFFGTLIYIYIYIKTELHKILCSDGIASGIERPPIPYRVNGECVIQIGNYLNKKPKNLHIIFFLTIKLYNKKKKNAAFNFFNCYRLDFLSHKIIQFLTLFLC